MVLIFLELKHKGDYNLSFNMIGYSDTTLSAKVNRKYTILNVQIKEIVKQLEAVEIFAHKIDIAKKVIKSKKMAKACFKLQV